MKKHNFEFYIKTEPKIGSIYNLCHVLWFIHGKVKYLKDDKYCEEVFYNVFGYQYFTTIHQWETIVFTQEIKERIEKEITILLLKN